MKYEEGCLYCNGTGLLPAFNNARCIHCVDGKLATPAGKELLDFIKRHLTSSLEKDIQCLEARLAPSPHRKFK